MAFLPLVLAGQRILRYSNESKRTTGDTVIRKITPQPYGKYVRIRYYDGSKQKIFKDSLWGYIDKKGTVYRIYHRRSYSVLENDEIVNMPIKSMWARRGGPILLIVKTWIPKL
jgi:hypothetical protein